jgi:hypothetical protein
VFSECPLAVLIFMVISHRDEPPKNAIFAECSRFGTFASSDRGIAGAFRGSAF